MTKEKVKQMFIDCFELSMTKDELKDDVALFGPNSPFGLDSMDILKFITIIKDEFQINLGSIRTDTFSTVNQITQTIEEHQGAPAQNS
ncbi:acyl carrier protein [Kroppenstedtia eburnea]|uniref:Acyl carrier protein n=1 Tax=Kroppenstedtia eburnea TaxID=714067 RepID=A0A1N7PWT1_9BACL|nr:acyl carrier protein [Kroppenstedtia eburnea]QKI80918.1 acyl carrier protein [Kroppenstedtia eburnea]SIT14897.1 acyl carrier protein [Kroppenstedtia eburnea]